MMVVDRSIAWMDEVVEGLLVLRFDVNVKQFDVLLTF